MSTGDVAQGPWSAGRGIVGSAAAADHGRVVDQQTSTGDSLRARGGLGATSGRNSEPFYSNGSYTSYSRSRVSRSLFGPSDSEENAKTLTDVYDDIYYRDRNRWNFDFVRESAISGGRRYDWKRVVNGSSRSNGPGDDDEDAFWSPSKKANSKYYSSTSCQTHSSWLKGKQTSNL